MGVRLSIEQTLNLEEQNNKEKTKKKVTKVHKKSSSIGQVEERESLKNETVTNLLVANQADQSFGGI